MFKVLMALSLMVGFCASAEEGSWTDKIKMSGDLRIRHDYTKQDQLTDRHRERYRLRLATSAKINDKMTAKARLTSADGGGDPISNNSSFTGNSSKKAVYIDLAMVDYRMSESCGVVAGKQENPLRVLPGSQLVFDADYTPEGVAFDGKSGAFMAKLSGFSLAERGPDTTGAAPSGNSEPDSYLLSALLGMKTGSETDSGMTFAAAYHEFTALKNNAGLTAGGSDLFMGNSTVLPADNRYKYNFKVTEAMAEFHSRMGEQKISLFLDGIMNGDPSEENVGYLAGVILTGLDDKDKVEWTLGYNYRSVERDATVSGVNDSDFANGMDGSNGHTISASYAVMDNAMLSLGYFIANVANNPIATLRENYHTERGLLDFQVNF